MQRLIKGFAVGILCLQWSLSASAENKVFATCGSVTKNPDPPDRLANTSPTKLSAKGSFQLTCMCPQETTLTGGLVRLSIGPQNITRNGSPGIRLANSNGFTKEIIEITYGEMTTYDVNVSNPNEEVLQAGDYLVAVNFELSALPECIPILGND